MTRAAPSRIPSVVELDVLDPSAFAAAVAPLFEGAELFLARLAAARPFGDEAGFFRRATDVALALDDAAATQLLDAHPPLGAPPGSVSALSYREQGYDQETADAIAERDRGRVDAELARLNAAYEQAFGFRYCVFVAGRPRAALLDAFAEALTCDRDAELERGLRDVVRIAEDRYRTMRRESGR
jgi:2-oxo-4-hydroxy-4-carboxy--5-ureidoimidazoline (OHCU) decarboxylase